MLKDYRNMASVEPDNISTVIIGDTTYIVSSFFRKDAKGDVIDKVRRLIERDVENAASNKVFTGTPDRLEV